MHQKRLEQRIIKAINHANRDYRLIGDGDRILVAMSGGKDSYGLLWALQKLQAAASFKFELFAFHLDQGQPGHDTNPISRHLEAQGIPFEVEYQDTYTRVVEKTEPGKVYCSLCSRFRRAILYKAARRHGCNKVALGHHRDDLIETLLLNIFFSGQLKSMPPRLLADKGDLQLIRPLCYVPEEEMVELSQQQSFPVVPCKLCGSQEAQRAFVKGLLRDLSARFPHMKGNLLNSLCNVKPTHLLDVAVNPLFQNLGPIPDIVTRREAAVGGSDSAQVVPAATDHAHGQHRELPHVGSGESPHFDDFDEEDAEATGCGTTSVAVPGPRSLPVIG